MTRDDTDTGDIDDSVDPLTPLARGASLVLGSLCAAVGCVAIFLSDNQAGTAVVQVVALILLLLGLQGAPLLRFGSDQAQFELGRIRQRVSEAVDQVARESPELAPAVSEVVRAIDPDLGQVTHPSLVYEELVRRAIARVGVDLDPRHHSGPDDRGVDVRAHLASESVNVQVKYRSRGPIGLREVANAARAAEASGFPGGILLVTNAPLSDEVRQHSSETGAHPQRTEVITWNDERDDDLLLRALTRNARR